MTTLEIATALQWAWNDFVADTGDFPDCFEWRSRKLFADFGRGNFARMVADSLNHARTVPPSNPVAGPPDADDWRAKVLPGDLVTFRTWPRGGHGHKRLAVVYGTFGGGTPPNHGLTIYEFATGNELKIRYDDLEDAYRRRWREDAD